MLVHSDKDGYGNLEAGCEPCKCNPIGSRTEICDPVTGYCSCKPGVFGITCDSCLDGYFGFSRQGCQGLFYIYLSTCIWIVGV